MNATVSCDLMLTLADFEFFGTVARSRSLAAAARTIDVTPSAVTQRLQDLERRIGVLLVVRTGGRLALTEEGELLLARGRAIVDQVGELTELFASRRGEVVGHLRVLAPLGFGRRYVAPVAAAFAAAHPAVTIDLVLSDRPGGVLASDWDIAVHVGESPAQRRATARVLAPNARVLCASPAYVARAGAPDSPKALVSHRCIALRENDEDVTLWRFVDASAVISQVRIAPVLASNDGDVVREWALAGHGIVVRSEWSIADDLRRGDLVPILGDHRLPSADVVAFIGARRGRLARTSQFMQLLRSALSPTPWRTFDPPSAGHTALA